MRKSSRMAMSWLKYSYDYTDVDRSWFNIVMGFAPSLSTLERLHHVVILGNETLCHKSYSGLSLHEGNELAAGLRVNVHVNVFTTKQSWGA